MQDDITAVQGLDRFLDNRRAVEAGAPVPEHCDSASSAIVIGARFANGFSITPKRTAHLRRSCRECEDCGKEAVW